MDRVARWITEHSRLIVAFFAAAAIVCAVLFFGVKVNYDMTAYLPADAESTVALQIGGVFRIRAECTRHGAGAHTYAGAGDEGKDRSRPRHRGSHVA